MPSYQDLSGQVSGTLLAKQYLGKSHWLCECQKCGNIINVPTFYFNKLKETKHDGCKHVIPVVPNTSYGYLTVLEQAEDYVKPKTGKHERQWLCQCVCGRKKIILESNLKAYKSLTCGLCSNRISIPEKAIYYYLSKIFSDIEENYRPDFLNGKEIDIYIPTIKLGIEYDGERWHKNIQADIDKDLSCKEQRIKIIHVREPRCINSGAFEVVIITPKPTTNGTHMTQPIKQIIDILNEHYNLCVKLDVDCLRDNADICKRIISSAGFNSLRLKAPQISSEWDYQKNAPLTPDNVSVHSGKKAFWICPKGHSYSSVIASRTGKDACGCPVCSNRGTALYKNGIYIGEHSLAKERPDIACEFMEEKNGLSADMISVSSNKKMWFKCRKCGHEWMSKINNRTSSNNQGCPKCAKEKQSESYHISIILERGNLLDLYPELCKEWDYNKNHLSPKQFTAGSKTKVYWICSRGHSYLASINHRTSKKPTGCPICRGRRKILNSDTGEIFVSLQEAAKSIGFKKGDSIRLCCKGEKKQAGGYHWQYYDE